MFAFALLFLTAFSLPVSVFAKENPHSERLAQQEDSSSPLATPPVANSQNQQPQPSNTDSSHTQESTELSASSAPSAQSNSTESDPRSSQDAFTFTGQSDHDTPASPKPVAKTRTENQTPSPSPSPVTPPAPAPQPEITPPATFVSPTLTSPASYAKKINSISYSPPATSGSKRSAVSILTPPLNLLRRSPRSDYYIPEGISTETSFLLEILSGGSLLGGLLILNGGRIGQLVDKLRGLGERDENIGFTP